MAGNRCRPEHAGRGAPQEPDIHGVQAGGGFSTLPVARLHAQKGLPFKFDVGAFLSTAPDSNIRLFGAELRYAFLEPERTVQVPRRAMAGIVTPKRHGPMAPT